MQLGWWYAEIFSIKLAVHFCMIQASKCLLKFGNIEQSLVRTSIPIHETRLKGLVAKQ